MDLTEIHARQVEMLRLVAGICDEHSLKYYLIGGTLLGAVRHNGFIPWDDDADIGMPRSDYDKFWAIAKEELPQWCQLIDYRSEWRLPSLFSKLVDRRTELFETWVRQEYRVRLGVYIDIFALDGVPGRSFTKWWHYLAVSTLRRVLIANVIENGKDRSLAKRVVIGLIQWALNESRVRAIQRRLDRLMRKFRFEAETEVCNYCGAWGRRELVPQSWFADGSWMCFEGQRLRTLANWDEYLKQLYGRYMELPPVDQRRSHHRFRVTRVNSSTES